jgi:hypothetical protein
MTEKKALLTEVDLSEEIKNSITAEMFSIFPVEMQFKYYRIKEAGFAELTKKIIIVEYKNPDYNPCFFAICHYSSKDNKWIGKHSKYRPGDHGFYWDGLEESLKNCQIRITKDNVLQYLDTFFLITSNYASSYAPKIIYELSDLDFMKRTNGFKDKLFNYLLRKSFHKPTVKKVKNSKQNAYTYKVNAFVLFSDSNTSVTLAQFDIIVDETGNIISFDQISFVDRDFDTQKIEYLLLFDRYDD